MSEASAKASSKDRKNVIETQQYTILVVEDVDEIGANMSASLNKRGHRLMRASTAEQAIEMAEKNRPAMILTDSDLPTLDQLMELLRCHSGLKDLIVAIMDINDLKLGHNSVTVLNNFQALDDLLKPDHRNEVSV